MARRHLRGTKITGDHWDEQPGGRKGKRCEITGDPRYPSEDIHSVKECARVCRSHWFDADTLRFFKSRVGSIAYRDGRGGAYFTTSEKGPNDIRAYSVRHYDPDRCGINTVGKFQQYRTSAQADRAAKKLATSGGVGRRK